MPDQKTIHKAYVMVTSANFMNAETGEYERRFFDKPRHKMLASGSEEYCRKAIEKHQEHYLDGYPAEDYGIEEFDTSKGPVGNPWDREWPERA